MLCSYVNITLLIFSLKNMNIKSQSGTHNCWHLGASLCFLGTALQVLTDPILQQYYEVDVITIPTFQRRQLRHGGWVMWQRLHCAAFLTSGSDLTDLTTLLCDSPVEHCSVLIIRAMWKAQLWGRSGRKIRKWVPQKRQDSLKSTAS